MKKLLLAAAALVLVWTACRKNIEEPALREPLPEELVTASITGIVLNEAGNPLTFATVEVGGNNTETNGQGVFSFQNVLLNKKGALVNVSYPGHHKAFRFVYPNVGSVAYTEIRMRLMRPPDQQISDFTQLFVITSGDLSVDVKIPYNSLGLADGSVWSGGVLARTVAFDPTQTEDLRVLPGDFRAQDHTGAVRFLKSFGMFGIELINTSGEPLQFLPGKKAQIRLRIPNSLTAVAPAAIPLWHFNKNTGYWEEEGSATLDNGRYEWEAGHFSYWNCGTPEDFAFIDGRIVNPLGAPISFCNLQASHPNIGIVDNYTDSDGNFRFLVPAQEILKLQIGAGCTNQLVDIGSFGPSSENDLGDISLSSAIVQYSGQLLGCNGAPFANGVVYIVEKNNSEVSNRLVTVTDNNGAFSIYTNHCNPPGAAFARGYDLATGLTSTWILDANLSEDIVHFPNISLCNPLEEYIQMEFEHQAPIYYNVDPSLTIEGDSLFIKGNFVNSASEMLDIHINLTYPKVLAGQDNSLFWLHARYEENSLEQWAQTLGAFVQMTNIPNAIGEFGTGTIYSRAVLSDGTSTPFTITFRVKRDQ